jgi:hypothetical protein
MVSVSASPSAKYRAHTFHCMRCPFRMTARIECDAAFDFEDEAAVLAHARALALEMGNFDLPQGSLIVSDLTGAILGKIPVKKRPSKLN